MARHWNTGEKVTITYGDKTVSGHIVLASPNGRSLMLGFDGMLGGFVGMMPVLQTELDGPHQDLVEGKSVTIFNASAEKSS